MRSTSEVKVHAYCGEKAIEFIDHVCKEPKPKKCCCFFLIQNIRFLHLLLFAALNQVR